MLTTSEIMLITLLSLLVPIGFIFLICKAHKRRTCFIPLPLKCVVMDIETLSTSASARVFSVGLVVGDLLTGKIEASQQFNVNPDLQPWRITDQSTLEFWESERKKDPTAWDRNHLNQYPTMDSFFNAIEEFLLPHGELPVFGNGPEFDNAIMEDLYSSFGLKLSWHRGCNQSVRTMVLIGRQLLNIDPKYDATLSEGLVKHVALDDAILEFKYCSFIYRGLVKAV